MKKIVFDFQIIDSEDKLYDLIEKELDINQYIKDKWGRNLHAFWDLYSYSKDSVLFEIKNYENISDKNFKSFIDVFIQYLEDLKGYKDNGKKITPNPNFDYKIIS